MTLKDEKVINKGVEGWGWPVSRKAHYFVAGMSLCNKWMFTGDVSGDPTVSGPDDCKDCARRAAKRAGIK